MNCFYELNDDARGWRRRFFVLRKFQTMKNNIDFILWFSYSAYRNTNQYYSHHRWKNYPNVVLIQPIFRAFVLEDHRSRVAFGISEKWRRSTRRRNLRVLSSRTRILTSGSIPPHTNPAILADRRTDTQTTPLQTSHDVCCPSIDDHIQSVQ